MAFRRVIGRRRLRTLLLCGSHVFILIMLFLVLHQSMSLDYSWLEIGDDGSPENEYNCTRILQGEKEEIERAKVLSISRRFRNLTRVTDEDYVELTQDCERFRVTRKYLEFPLSQEEEDFPLAYSLLVHQKVQTFERLLRAIYTPQNLYCIHVDNEAPPSVMSAVISIISCFDNVFLASHLETVVYASWSRVQADITCMEDLYQVSPRWKYFINLCGQDFPIKTNLEIVKRLRALDGTNSLETEAMPPHKAVRWKKSHQIVNGVLTNTERDKEPPPHGLPMFSGGAYIVVSRGFVRHVLEDPTAQALIAWAKDTFSPDEFLWATLQRTPGVPGSLRTNSKYDVTDVNSISRLVKWVYHEGTAEVSGALYPPCQGTHVRAVCVYGAGDLQWMLQQHQVFANKFDMDMDPIAIHCLEKHLRHKALAALN